ncbi:DMT family transporter [Ruegeria sediminis]|uniref:DMT family transporter n=1 Tax=Ruegeria sediminis TaxID=2583820 RepID=A0ABY2X3Z1_9RHOB|nr:DMT family transporter [Ruegeria sediminis]TMV09670.1 DMT family transporter [Ruegeria sediminis]
MQAIQRTSPVAASLLMVAAMAIIGVIDNFVVRLAQDIGLWQFHFTRALLMLPLVCGLSLLGLGSIRPLRPGVVVLRSALIALAMLFYFSALALMPIAQALAGLFTSPIFVLLISSLGMGQRIGPWRILAVAIGFAGILCVLQPDPRAFDAKVLIPVAGGLFYALAAVITRAYCAGESTVALLGGMVLALGLAGAAGLIGLALFPIEPVAGPAGFVARGWVWPMGGAAPWVVLQAVGSSLAVFMLIKAYQLGEPSYVAVFEYSVMIFGPLFAWVALGQTLGAPQILGVGLIAFAGGIIALRSG